MSLVGHVMLSMDKKRKFLRFTMYDDENKQNHPYYIVVVTEYSNHDSKLHNFQKSGETYLYLTV